MIRRIGAIRIPFQDIIDNMVVDEMLPSDAKEMGAEVSMDTREITIYYEAESAHKHHRGECVQYLTGPYERCIGGKK